MHHPEARYFAVYGGANVEEDAPGAPEPVLTTAGAYRGVQSVGADTWRSGRGAFSGLFNLAEPETPGAIDRAVDMTLAIISGGVDPLANHLVRD